MTHQCDLAIQFAHHIYCSTSRKWASCSVERAIQGLHTYRLQLGYWGHGFQPNSGYGYMRRGLTTGQPLVQGALPSRIPKPCKREALDRNGLSWHARARRRSVFPRFCYICRYIGCRSNAMTTREIGVGHGYLWLTSHSRNGCLSVFLFYVGRGLLTADMSSREARQMSLRF
jgi:hypothetical protein